MTETELKPCPFCAGKARQYIDDGGQFPQHLVGCAGACEWAIDYKTWQSRPLEDGFRDALESVSKALRNEIETTTALRAELAQARAIVTQLCDTHNCYPDELATIIEKDYEIGTQNADEVIRLRAELAEYKVALAETKIDIQNGVLVLADERKQYENLLAELAALRERLQKPCEWKYVDVDSCWSGACGVLWQFEDGTPEDNEMNFCPQCGQPLHTILPEANDGG